MDERAFLEKNITLQKELNSLLFEYPLPEKPSSLYAPVKYTMQSRGKRLRPILLIVLAEMFGCDKQIALHAGLAVEALHTFTLVHDDIMDNDNFRRGVPTVHKKWNINTAILAGDGLIAVAYRELMLTGSPRLADIGRIYSEGIITICEGQALDKDFETRDDVRQEEYLSMIGRKTATLFQVCAEIGVLLGTTTDEALSSVLPEIRNFSYKLGLAFQLQDDLLDFTADQTKLGKDTWSDFRCGKKTYPLLYLYEHAGAEDIATVNSLLGHEALSKDEIAAVDGIFREYDVFTSSEQLISGLMQEARGHLLNLQGTDTSFLQEYIKYVLKREF